MSISLIATTSAESNTFFAMNILPNPPDLMSFINSYW